MINSIIKNSAPIPTVFSADLNIRPQSYSVTKISEVLTCHTADFTDTLSPSHKVKQDNVFPDGLAVDHVFSKGIKHLDTKGLVVDFSEHQALITNFIF
jgi:endonuclease/exonuclease/phosphatase (EEP) superfamily protein YafD